MRAVVERYDGDGVDDVAADRPVRVKYWHAGNEWPNWIARGKRTADYVQFVRLFAEAVHHADPEARVVLIDRLPLVRLIQQPVQLGGRRPEPPAIDDTASEENATRMAGNRRRMRDPFGS